MNEQFQGKLLVMASLAALIGMDGFFSLIDRRIRGKDNELAIQATVSPAESTAILIPHIVPQSLCTQDNLPSGEDTEHLEDNGMAPLIDEEFERIDRNENQQEILHNVRNMSSGRQAQHSRA
jgi:hypothetical protein